MTTSDLHLVWANKPGCSKPVAEFWMGESDLWFTMYLDDGDKKLKVEVLPTARARTTHLLEWGEMDHLIETAKSELLAMADTAIPV